MFSIQAAGWAILHPKQASAARKAMNIYRKLHPNCEITGSTKKVQIHHIIPVWADPSKAADPDNFIALSISANIHHIFGHACSFRNRYVENVQELAALIREIRNKSIVIQRPIEVKSLKMNWLQRIKNSFK